MTILSSKALEVLAKRWGHKEKILRITVTSGGCAGMTYDAVIDGTMHDEDKVIAVENGITIVTNEESSPYLKGLEIDYSDDLISAGFRFSNKSNDASCGCGASFNVTGFPVINKQGVTCES